MVIRLRLATKSYINTQGRVSTIFVCNNTSELYRARPSVIILRTASASNKNTHALLEFIPHKPDANLVCRVLWNMRFGQGSPQQWLHEIFAGRFFINVQNASKLAQVAHAQNKGPSGALLLDVVLGKHNGHASPKATPLGPSTAPHPPSAGFILETSTRERERERVSH